MNITGIPKSIIAANTAVVHELAGAGAAIKTLSAGSRGAAAKLERALEAVANARSGIEHLGSGNLLDGAVGRWAIHAERDLTSAAEMVQRRGKLSADGVQIFEQRLTDARRSIRLATEAGERSLESPSRRAAERATSFAAEHTDSTGHGPVWVDGEWLDDLGNPARRGGDSWTGPDGQSFGWDGSASRDYGSDWVSGPDGLTYGGI